MIEGQSSAPSNASSEDAPAPPPPLWWRWWRASPETALPGATVVMAVATLMAAIAAGFSAWAAFRQETATYQSVLYNRQFDAVAKLPWEVNSGLEMLSNQIKGARGSEARGESRVGGPNNVVEQVAAEIKTALVATSLVFPVEQFPELQTRLQEAISESRDLIAFLNKDPSVPHLITDDRDEAKRFSDNKINSFNKASHCARKWLDILVECARQQLGKGHAVQSQSARDCATAARLSVLPRPRRATSRNAFQNRDPRQVVIYQPAAYGSPCCINY